MGFAWEPAHGFGSLRNRRTWTAKYECALTASPIARHGSGRGVWARAWRCVARPEFKAGPEPLGRLRVTWNHGSLAKAGAARARKGCRS